jgi:hypothetical protein
MIYLGIVRQCIEIGDYEETKERTAFYLLDWPVRVKATQAVSGRMRERVGQTIN